MESEHKWMECPCADSKAGRSWRHIREKVLNENRNLCYEVRNREEKNIKFLLIPQLTSRC